MKAELDALEREEQKLAVAKEAREKELMSYHKLQKKIQEKRQQQLALKRKRDIRTREIKKWKSRKRIELLVQSIPPKAGGS